jgi:hypothetical protein
MCAPVRASNIRSSREFPRECPSRSMAASTTGPGATSVSDLTAAGCTRAISNIRTMIGALSSSTTVPSSGFRSLRSPSARTGTPTTTGVRGTRGETTGPIGRRRITGTGHRGLIRRGTGRRHPGLPRPWPGRRSIGPTRSRPGRNRSRRAHRRSSPGRSRSLRAGRKRRSRSRNPLVPRLSSRRRTSLRLSVRWNESPAGTEPGPTSL